MRVSAGRPDATVRGKELSMILPIYPAHGALGIFDELIFLGIAVVFLIFMGITWVRSRAEQPAFDDEPDVFEPDPAQPAPDDPAERFKLD
jgi:hypothetical protein